MTRGFRFTVIRHCAAPSDVVFRVLDDVARWPEWMPGVARAGWEPAQTPGTSRTRFMRVALGPTAREEVIIDEPPRHQAYVLVSGLPARDYRGDVWICDQSGGSVITWEVGFNPAYPATGSIIRLAMRWSIVLFAAALARQAERMATGEG